MTATVDRGQRVTETAERWSRAVVVVFWSMVAVSSLIVLAIAIALPYVGIEAASSPWLRPGLFAMAITSLILSPFAISDALGRPLLGEFRARRRRQSNEEEARLRPYAIVFAPVLIAWTIIMPVILRIDTLDLAWWESQGGFTYVRLAIFVFWLLAMFSGTVQIFTKDPEILSKALHSLAKVGGLWGPILAGAAIVTFLAAGTFDHLTTVGLILFFSTIGYPVALVIGFNAVRLLWAMTYDGNHEMVAGWSAGRKLKGADPIGTEELWAELKTWRAAGPCCLYDGLAEPAIFWKPHNPALLWKDRYETVGWGCAIWGGFLVAYYSFKGALFFSPITVETALLLGASVALFNFAVRRFFLATDTTWRKTEKRVLRRGDTIDAKPKDWLITDKGERASITAVVGNEFIYRSGTSDAWKERSIMEIRSAFDRAEYRKKLLYKCAAAFSIYVVLLSFGQRLNDWETDDAEILNGLWSVLTLAVALYSFARLRQLSGNLKDEWLYESGAQWIIGAKVLDPEPEQPGLDEVKRQTPFGAAGFASEDEIDRTLRGDDPRRPPPEFPE